MSTATKSAPALAPETSPYTGPQAGDVVGWVRRGCWRVVKVETRDSVLVEPDDEQARSTGYGGTPLRARTRDLRLLRRKPPTPATDSQEG